MSVFVVDANIVVSAALSSSSVSRQAIATARQHGTIALSEAVFGEFGEVLARPKFRRAISDDRRREVLECGFRRKPPTYSNLMPPTVLK